MNKKLLMVTFDFPSSNAASIQRIYSFYKYLCLWEWEVHVLTAKEYAYPVCDLSSFEIDKTLVHRTMTLDVMRHLSFKGKYLSITNTPDRWGLTWIPSALMKGKSLCKQEQFDAIWSTAPIPSAHYIASKLSEKFSIPWIADYRDPCHYVTGSAGKRLDDLHQKIDARVFKLAKKITFATAGIRDVYKTHYPEAIESKSRIVENGFDEDNFHQLENLIDYINPFQQEKFSLYYSGVLYSNGRDPVPIFEAIASLKENQTIGANNFELIFQGAGDGLEFTAVIEKLGIKALVKFIAGVPFLHALKNMMSCNALLLIQDSRFNSQIPGKMYEYLRTHKPILVKADKQGLTAKAVLEHEGTIVCYQNDIIDALLAILSSQSRYNRNVKKFTREEKAILLLNTINSSLLN
jgi:hypothetical protein